MSNLSYRLNNPTNPLSSSQVNKVVSFLHTHLQEYGDPSEQIEAAIAYAMGKNDRPGGFVLYAEEGDKTVGAVVVNRTGMSGYIPENILVYIAVHESQRGKGVGKTLMKKSLEAADGDVALHVEPNNPAKFLYEKLGFENKYLEMRFKKEAV
jgi:ribosomal-protein-alanine N-acetyltransferase